MKDVLRGDMILYLTSLHPHLNLQDILTFMLTFLAISVQLYSPEMNCVLIFELENKCIYILELTVGFESNLLTNATRKRQKYEELINEQHKYYEKVKFVNLSISSLGVFSHSSLSFIEMLKDLNFDDKCRKCFVRKIINTCIRTSYYVFCKHNKEWNNPQLMKQTHEGRIKHDKLRFTMECCPWFNPIKIHMFIN